MNPYLELVFNTKDNEEYTYKVTNCNINVTDEDVNKAMVAIVDANPFVDIDIQSKKSANLVTQVVVDFTI